MSMPDPHAADEPSAAADHAMPDAAPEGVLPPAPPCPPQGRLAHVMGLDPSGGDLTAGAAAVYSSIRHAFQLAVAGELHRNIRIERQLRARGRSVGRGPVQAWKGLWVGPGFCEWHDDGPSCVQVLLPEHPPNNPPPDPP